MAPLILELRNYPLEFDVKVSVTGQHKGMLYQALKIFQIDPEIDLNVMTPGQDLLNTTSKILLGMGQVLEQEKPDIVLVHGDTTTTFATSLAAFYLNIPVGHIEAGLRTHNMKAPFPEEFNRQTVSKIAKLHFAPTNGCMNNLISESVDKSKIFVTGNTVVDALEWVLNRVMGDSAFAESVYKTLNSEIKFDWKSKPFVLITGHRRENFGAGFEDICLAIAETATRYPELNFIYPVHMNPQVQEPVKRILGRTKNVFLINPVDYAAFSVLLERCLFVLTDSGGIQEEAPSLGKPVLLMRETTERPESIERGTTYLVGAVKSSISEGMARLIEDTEWKESMSLKHTAYGDGTSAKKIVSILRTIKVD
jgi:UDP-N-acetylglucosamine 2-epimerase (non-hydrolysing)